VPQNPVERPELHGRQGIVYGLMKTSDGVSPKLSQDQLYFSNIMFFILYSMLFAVFIYVLNNKIQHGPEPAEIHEPLVKLPQRIRDFLNSKRKT
ncbi:MAG: cytochrome ubiquinol oxidase subunit I, partial [bacterium]